MFATLGRRLRYFVRRRAAEMEMNEEMRLHLDLEIADRVRQGMSPAEARRTALADFGGIEFHKEAARDARGVRLWQDTTQDIRYAARVLRQSPLFTVTSVLTLAIGMAATTAVMAIVNAVLFRPPPVPDVDRVFVVAEVWNNGQQSTSTDLAQPMYPFAHYLQVRNAVGSVFSGLAGYRYGSVAVRFADEARPVSSIAASANYFRVLGIRPALGHFFSDTSETSGSEREVVISHDLWHSEFGGDSAIIGRALSIDSRPAVIAGVAPHGFMGTMSGLVADMWLRAADVRASPGAAADNVARRAGNVTMVGRLQPGLTPKQASAGLNAIASHLVPDQPWQKITGMTLDQVVGPPAMSRLIVAGFMGLLFLTAALVLAIAAANIAGLLIARGAHRHREIAIRLALGAGRGRLVRQLLAESMALCVMGGITGVILANWLVSLLPAIQPPIGVRTALNPHLDIRVLLVSFSLSLLVGVGAGLVPALQSTGFDPLRGLRTGGGGSPCRSARSRSVFVVAQVAMSLVLLATAGLFTRATQQALLVDAGLDATRVAVAEVSLSAHGYDAARGREFFDRLMSRLSARTEIEAVGLGQWTPLAMSHNGMGIEAPDGSRVGVTWGVASPGYLETVRIPLADGRLFNERDTESSPPVILVNETLARRFWPGERAIGRQLKLNGVREVIGVVKDGKYRGLAESPTAYAFLPYAQAESRRLAIHARGRTDAGSALRAIREEVLALDPNVALEKQGTLLAQLDIYSLPQRVAAASIGLFGLVGLVLAALGIYGVVAFHTAQRTREVGIRMALGARGAEVIGTMLKQGIRLAVAGVIVGVPVSIAVGVLARSLLYGVGAADPLTFAVVPGVLVVVALLASWIPARRAAHVDPIIALRSE